MARARTTSDVFNAIAEPKRRAILTYLGDGERQVGDVARALGMGQPSASKHLKVLRQLNIVRARRDGRRTLYRTNGESLKPVHHWAASFERHWTRQLEDIKRIAEEEASQSGVTDASNPQPDSGDSS